MKAFNNRFQSEDDCFAYLAAIKWKGNQYICRKCGNTTFHKGRSPYSRRCNRCKYDESVTAGTIFHRLKFSILTAFQIIQLMATSNKGNTSVELSHQFGITQTTALIFKYKVQSVMGRIAPRKLKGDVDIGFFDIQTEREDDYYWLIRRSKLRILVAVEVKNRIVVKAISQIVDGIKPVFVRQMINGHVSSSAHITIADGGERGFKKLAKEYGSLTVNYGWGHLDRYFAGFKQWIEAEFNQRYSFKHLQGYLDEYNFRVSHRRNPQRNFDILIRAMMDNEETNEENG